MLDLQAFVRRVKSGEEPSEAVDKMIEQASEQITQMFLSDKIDSNKSAQAWELIELLSANPVIPFHEIVNKPLFKAAPETGIMELENNGLITVSRDRVFYRKSGLPNHYTGQHSHTWSTILNSQSAKNPLLIKGCGFWNW